MTSANTGTTGNSGTINTETELSKDELVGIVTPDDEFLGDVATRKLVRGNNLWHRTTNILVMNEKG